MNRLKDNLEVLKILKQYLISNPDIRFSQALANLNIVVRQGSAFDVFTQYKGWKDEYYLEPMFILNRIRREE